MIGKKILGIVVAGVTTFGDAVASEEILQSLPMISYERLKSPGQEAIISFSYTPERVFESKIDVIPDETCFTTIKENFGYDTLINLASTYYKLEYDIKYSMGVIYSRFISDNIMRERILVVTSITNVLFNILNR
jgi:hypothetical protein